MDVLKINDDDDDDDDVPRVSGARGEDGNWRPVPSACQTGKRRRRSPSLLGV